MIRDDVHTALAALEAMKLEELRIAWVRRMKSSPPKISAGLLRLALAHALQSKALGSITKSTDRRLSELAAGSNGPPPGTRLSRSWQGKLHIVTVTDENKFSWQGKDWDSLSVIARTITGTALVRSRLLRHSCEEGSMTRVRCAIYTRKSSEEGLEQDFNSLDAQFEACAAYIKSQASEGWLLGKERYDDGGVSGGTLVRPGLNRLLEDIAAGRIDIVVVYKVDRLTRSLLDFAKLVEALDKAGTSFVSITQSFNTTTSMGRLTLNMLLSFAQFEREVTAERIRDKIAQSKARGMWMGGNPPLGYRPEGRSLAIVEPHAAIIRDIFDRYLRLGNMRLLQNELRSNGIVKPDRTTAAGRAYGGAPFNRSELYKIIGNRIYVGEIVHRDKIFPGLHPPIINSDAFAAAQELLSRYVKGDRTPRDAQEQSLLASRIVDDCGEPLIATHASKKAAAGKRRYRYYVTRGLLQGNGKGMRIPALELEHVVVARLTEMLDNPLSVLEHHATTDAVATQRAIQRGQELAAALRNSRVEGQRALVRRMVGNVIVGDDKLVIKVNWPALCELLEVPVHVTDEDVLLLETVARLTRSGRAIRMVQHDGRLIRSTVDLTLVRLIVKARRWWQRLQQERGLTVSGLAASDDVTQSYVTRILRLAFLSPDVVKAIMTGTQPGWLDSGSLCSRDSVSLDWGQQKQNLLLGRAS